MTAPDITLTAPERDELLNIASSPDLAPAVRIRGNLILLAAGGKSNCRIAAHLGVSRPTVVKWRRTFANAAGDRIACLLPTPRRNVRHDLVTAKVLHEVPFIGTWTTRRMQQETGVSRSTVSRVWKQKGIIPAGIGVHAEMELPDGLSQRLYGVAAIFSVTYLTALVFAAHRRPQFLSALPVAVPDRRETAVQRFVDAMSCLDGMIVGGHTATRADVLKFLERVHSEFDDSELHVLLSGYVPIPPGGVQEWQASMPRLQFHGVPLFTSLRPWVTWVNLWTREAVKTTESIEVSDSIAAQLQSALAVKTLPAPPVLLVVHRRAYTGCTTASR
jgi:transposase